MLRPKTIISGILLLPLFLLSSLDGAAHSAEPGSTYPIQGTFLNFYRNLTPELWAREFHDMKDVNIKTVVVLSVGHLRSDAHNRLGFSLAPEGLLYPSSYVGAPERPTKDLLELTLSLADQQGMDVFLGSLQTAGDWTTGREFRALRAYNKRVAAEILQRYGHHPSLRGWYFTQELWMNWVKYYSRNYNAADYYGVTLLANWVSDLRNLDRTKLTTTSLVVKQTGKGSMPGLTAAELNLWTSSLLCKTALDILMPQDGIGAENGAPSLADLPIFFDAMATAASTTRTTLWDTLETFTSVPGLSGEQYPPAEVSRIEQQVSAVRPYVAGYISWIFGDDMSPQATYYAAQAGELNRQYKSVFGLSGSPAQQLLRIGQTLF